jgi:hypothetical protein
MGENNMTENWMFQATQTIQAELSGYAISFQMGENNKVRKIGATPTSKWVDDHPDVSYRIYSVECNGSDKESVMEALPRLIAAIKTGAEAA